MLLVPWVIGCGIARDIGLKEWFLLLAILMFFLAQNQILNRIRLKFASAPNPSAVTRIRISFFIFTAIGILAIIPLLIKYHLWSLFYFGGIAIFLTAMSMYLVNRRLDRSLTGQVLAAGGLSLSAPLAYYAGWGTVNRMAVELWIINFLFFLGGVFYVQLKIDALAQRSQPLKSVGSRLAFARKTLITDSAIAATVLMILMEGPMSLWAILALVPIMIQAIVGTFRLNHPAKLKRVGILSTIHSILFAAILIWLA